MEVQVSKQEAKLLIQDFDPSKDYDFQIIAVRGSEQSRPLQAKHEGKRWEGAESPEWVQVLSPNGPEAEAEVRSAALKGED